MFPDPPPPRPPALIDRKITLRIVNTEHTKHTICILYTRSSSFGSVCSHFQRRNYIGGGGSRSLPPPLLSTGNCLPPCWKLIFQNKKNNLHAQGRGGGHKNHLWGANFFLRREQIYSRVMHANYNYICIITIYM